MRKINFTNQLLRLLTLAERGSKKVLRKIRPRLTNHLRTKMIVVLMAIALWSYIVTEDEYTYAIHVPIQVENVKAGKIIENEYPHHAKVLFWGKGKNLLGLLMEPHISVRLDLEDVSHHACIKLTKELIPRHKLDVEPIEIIEPDSIEIKLTNLREKKVPINSNITISPVAGYTVVGNIVLNPDSAWIVGPEKEIENIETVSTQITEFKNIDRSLTRTVELIPFNSEKTHLQTQQVEMYVDVQKLMEKVIPRVPVEVRNLPEDLHAFVIPPNLSLTLEGGVKVLAGVTEKEIVAYIDYKRKKKKNETGHPAIIKTPPGIIYRDATPRTFKIVIERKKDAYSWN